MLKFYCGISVSKIGTPKFDRSRQNGRFSEESTPPAKPVLVHLSEPLLEKLDEFGKKNGTGRGRSIEFLLKDLLPDLPGKTTPESIPRAQKHLVELVLVRKSDPVYLEYRREHYIPNRGLVGQQLQYLIFYDTKLVGIIGGASAVFMSESRDQYFNLSIEKSQKTIELNSIVNNNIFKLDFHAPNLATIVISLWRNRIRIDWENLYGVAVAGFETFVIEERLWNGKTRNGACYRADNWDLTGITKGYGDTNVRGREHKNKALKSKKLIYCRKIKGVKLCSEYSTAWNNPEKSHSLSLRREEMFLDPLDILLKTLQ